MLGHNRRTQNGPMSYLGAVQKVCHARGELFGIWQCRAFSVSGPVTWNGLPVTLRQIPVHHSISFLPALKIVMFDRGWAGSASE